MPRTHADADPYAAGWEDGLDYALTRLLEEASPLSKPAHDLVAALVTRIRIRARRYAGDWS